VFIQWWRPLANYAVKAGVVCLQVKLCDPHLSALEVRFSRRDAIQIIYVYLYLYHSYTAINNTIPVCKLSICRTHRHNTHNAWWSHTKEIPPCCSYEAPQTSSRLGWQHISPFITSSTSAISVLSSYNSRTAHEQQWTCRQQQPHVVGKIILGFNNSFNTLYVNNKTI